MQQAWRPGLFSIFLTCVFCSWHATENHAQSSWQISPRLQAGVEYDDNIYESSTRNVATTAGRMLFQTRVERNAARWRFDADYAGALQVYPEYRNENKLLHDLNGGVLWQAAERLRIFARGQATLKLYLDEVTDYGTTTGVAGVAATLTPRTSLELSAETGQLDYAIGDEFDFIFTGAWVAMRFRPGGTLLCETALWHRQFEYPARQILSGAGILQTSPQSDDLTTARLAASYGRKFFLRARLEAQRNRSNRDIFDYDRVQVYFLFGGNLTPRWLLRAALMLQRKNYLMPSSPVSLPELDPEREQSNLAVLDLTRTLSVETSWLLRLAYHNNETPVRGLFYRKVLIFSGFELRF